MEQMTPDSMRQARCDVLVVGAGPTGLTAAMQLAVQGVDVVIHEAINLGHKLKLVLKDQTDPSLLKSYEREWRPIALTVQRVTDFAFGIVIASESSGVRFLRRVVLPRVLGSHLVQRQMMKAMSVIRQAREQIAAMRKAECLKR